MDIAFNLLLATHLLALAVGTATAVAMPVVMRRLADAGPDTRPLAAGIGARLGRNSRIAFAVLLLSGVAMVWLRYGGVGGLNVWFWIKMALIVVVLAALVAGAVMPPGRLDPRAMGWVVRLALAGIIVSAVFAFNG